VPVRATFTPDTTTGDLLDQLQNAHNDTLEHQHVALSDIHRITGQDRLFDTVFVYENYPTDAGTQPGGDGLAITGFSSRDYYHYPISVQAGPGRELELRVQYDTDVFDAESIDALMERFKKVLVEMTAHPGRRLSSLDLVRGSGQRRLHGWSGKAVSAQPETMPLPASGANETNGVYCPPATLVEQIVASIYAEVLGVDRIGVEESFFASGGDSISAMRAVAAINAALDVELTVLTLLGAPSVRGLAQHLENAPAQ
ncbi:non-ribosomal peptide synthetase, partial [Mycolicibacterium peregrinum]